MNDVSEHRGTRLAALNEALGALARAPSMRAGPLESAVARLIELAASVFEADRVNLWQITGEVARLRCVVHYDRRQDIHSRLRDRELAQIPRYLEALTGSRVLAVENAADDPRTQELARDYLLPHGVVSVLDASIRESDDMTGVLCIESQTPRIWSAEDEQLAGALADFATLALASERQRATEAALGASDEWLTHLLEHMDDVVLTMTSEGIVTYVSPSARWFGLSEATLRRRSWRELLLEDDQPAVQEAVLALIEAGSGSRRLVYRLQLGDKIRCHQAAVTVMRRPGRELQVVVVARDITEQRESEARQRRLEHELTNAQRLESVGRLAGGVAHEFNNLLSVISGNIELALLHDDPASTDDAVRQAGTAAQQAAVVVRQLLAFSRRQMLDVRSVEVPSLIEALVAMLQPWLRNEITLTRDIAADVAPVLADASEVQQVLLNLALNACDAMPEGGRLGLLADNVELDAADEPSLPEGGYVRLQVVDTGRGIAAATFSSIFEPYFTTKPEDEGTGLGLSVSLGIVEQHGGVLKVASTEGQGTTMTVLLPASS